MARVSLTSIINASFVQRFSGAAGSTKKTNPLQGASAVDLGSSLRYGAKTYTTAIQNLNSTIGLVNVADGALQQLGKLTDKMLALAEEATDASTGNSRRDDLDIEFKSLGRKFERVIESAELGGEEYLTEGGLAELFSRAGLDKEKSASIAQLFSRFVTDGTDEVLASETIKGERPVPIPPSAYAGTARRTTTYDSIFGDDASIRRRPDAFVVLEDLKALKSQITENVGALANARDVIGKNMTLVRETGLAMLEVADKITSGDDAEKVAEKVRDLVRQRAPGAFSQLDNLDPITVAALALTLSSSSSSSGSSSS